MNRICFSIVLVVSIWLSGCNAGVEPKDHMGEIYSVALNSLMEEDVALNDHIDFIAIDMSQIEHFKERDREQVLSNFKERYKVDIMEATFEELKEQGLYNEETMALDGVLLKIEKVDVTFTNEVVLEGSKYRSGLGGYRGTGNRSS
ncbi:peptide ABC transporter substrate-binding protein [Rossellomorea aquimaris]|uniref:peptide ABC transporter substrate-binding protein n=1 Tax=Rossellomorea aquimaris TaxID=189382 RepID=UPI001CD6F82C|nr:peptide ABC transporter substrate-binding protein [Rossellomorea aquimaris]MCA1055855.1 peptide ABC transporter substrate-binding protein [Rossellomorea aquimaris]